ncbi:expressed unknown protein [Seminavis robusta]|uniref:Uncharacterized protein n=1 Tax=Seminavis robusta TaxID=568900 RepID=A0A9N8HPJ6_9STRA|nr:expressed unknown protein [Seminavis robusta]|eukprot:Sro1075_g238410.1 n/a (1079) ;mRNA; f:10427-13759
MAEGSTSTTTREARSTTRTVPRFPKNESRSRSPAKRFPSNAPRSPSRKCARSKSPLQKTASGCSASFSKLVAINPLSSNDDNDQEETTDTPKSPVRKKETLNGSKLNSNQEAIPKSPTRRREKVASPTRKVAKEKVSSNPKSPSRRPKDSVSQLSESSKKLLSPSRQKPTIRDIPMAPPLSFDDDDEKDAITTTTPQDEKKEESFVADFSQMKEEETKPAKTGSRGGRPSPQRTRSGRNKSSLDSGTTEPSGEQQNDNTPERGPRKPPMPKPSKLRVRAESLLNHSLLGDSGNGLDMSLSASELNHNPTEPNHHQRRRRSSISGSGRRSSISESGRRNSTSQRSNVRSKSVDRSGGGRMIQRTASSSHGENPPRTNNSSSRPMRKTRSMPESTSTSPGNCSGRGKRSTDGENNRSGRGKRSTDGENNRSGRGKRSTDGENNRSGRGKRSIDGENNRSGRGKRSTDGENNRSGRGKRSVDGKIEDKSSDQRPGSDHRPGNRSSNSPDQQRRLRKTSPSAEEHKKSASPENGRRRGSASARRTRCRTRTDDEATKEESVNNNIKEKVDDDDISSSVHGGKRPASHSPARQARTSKFPSNGARSLSPARGNRDSNNPDKRGRRTAAPSGREGARRPAAEPTTPAPTPKEQIIKPLAPPSGTTKRESITMTTRESMTLATVFDMENSIRLGADDDGHDSSASEATDGGGDTMYQFDPTSMNSVSSFNRAVACESSLNNSGVFKMENVSKTNGHGDDDEEDEGARSDDSGGSYLPGAMGMSHQRPSSHSPDQRRESRQKRGDRVERGRDGRSRGKRRTSLTLDSVFDSQNASVPNLGRQSAGAHDASFRSHGHESDLSRHERRKKLQDRLRQKAGRRQDEEEEDDSDDDAGSVYLPSNMTGKSLTPPGSPRRSNAGRRSSRSPRNSAHQPLRRTRSSSRQARPRISVRTGKRVEEDEEPEKNDEKKEKNKAMKFLKNKLSKLKDKVHDEFSSSSMGFDPNEDDGEEECDPHNKKSSSKGENKKGEEEFDPYNKKGSSSKGENKKGVGKKLKGLFGKKEKKHHHQLLGSSGESESDNSFDVGRM